MATSQHSHLSGFEEAFAMAESPDTKALIQAMKVLTEMLSSRLQTIDHQLAALVQKK